MKTQTVAEILREFRKDKIPYTDDEQTFETPEHPEAPDTADDVELEWPQPSASIDDALLDAFKTYVLRLMLTALVKPSQVLNAMRRLEALREFPLKKEKQERMLAIAEARIKLRRRALDLKEAQIKERREAREAAAAQAAEKAQAAATAKAEKAANAAAKVAEKATKLAQKASRSDTKAPVLAQRQPQIVTAVTEPIPESVEFPGGSDPGDNQKPQGVQPATFSLIVD